MTEGLILFPVGERDIGETEIKGIYFQKENLLHIFYHFRASHKLLKTPEFGVGLYLQIFNWVSLVTQMAKNRPTTQET